MAAAAKRAKKNAQRSKGQRSASRAAAAAGRASQARARAQPGYKPSPAQRAAGRKLAAAGRWAQAHPQAAAKNRAKRALTPGEISWCPVQALATMLELTGHHVTSRDMLALYKQVASGPDDGATIAGTLEAAACYGLAGVRVVDYTELVELAPCTSPLLLGVELPEPHTVLDDGDGWWSWGESWEPFPGAVISEAWSVTWETTGEEQPWTPALSAGPAPHVSTAAPPAAPGSSAR
jgi:hypothetical protein